MNWCFILIKSAQHVASNADVISDVMMSSVMKSSGCVIAIIMLAPCHTESIAHCLTVTSILTRSFAVHTMIGSIRYIRPFTAAATKKELPDIAICMCTLRGYTLT